MKIGVNFANVVFCYPFYPATHCTPADPDNSSCKGCAFICCLTYEITEEKTTISTCSKQVFSVPFEEKRFKNFNTFGNGELDRQNSAIRDVMTKTSTTIEVCNAKDQSLTILVTGKNFGFILFFVTQCEGTF